jgi:hypothetical protein
MMMCGLITLMSIFATAHFQYSQNNFIGLSNDTLNIIQTPEIYQEQCKE